LATINQLGQKQAKLNKQHQYALTINWTGNTGEGTANYRVYERSHTIAIAGKPAILCSSDPAFRGDDAKHNPEELLVASLAGCHMLWYLHLCAEAGIIVTAYTDNATGIMEETANGGGHFVSVTLKPVVTITEQAAMENAIALHKKANELCFIANSVNFPVYHQPQIIVVK
jgi:organic hydroperoxide reductase OsmC/OhrA